MAKRLSLNYAQKYTIVTRYKLINATGGREDMMKECLTGRIDIEFAITLVAKYHAARVT